jgi:hypothetical protein
MAGRVLSPSTLLTAAWLVAAASSPSFGRGSVYQDAPYKKGETITIEGSVTDASGAAVEGMTVVLLASHRGFELPSFRRVEEGLLRVPTTTDARGVFAIEWTWNPYYDIFRVRAEGETAAEPGAGAAPAVLAEVDLTRRIEDGSPVVVMLEVADAGPHRAALAFDAAPLSDDQKRVFEEVGKPDRVDRLDMTGGDEVAWWYFGLGKSYHFRAGRLHQVSEFEPVKGP